MNGSRKRNPGESHGAIQRTFGRIGFGLLCSAICSLSPGRTHAQNEAAVFNSDFLYPDDDSLLRYGGRESVDTKLVFTAAKPPSFQVWWMVQDGNKESSIVRIGEAFGSGRRFKAESYEDVKLRTVSGNDTDRSRLMIHDSECDCVFVLVKDEIATIPLFFAVFHSTDNLTSPPLRVQVGQSFALPGEPPRAARVLSISDTQVRVRCEEKEFDLLKGSASAENLRVHAENADLFVDVPKGLALEYEGSIPGIDPALPSNVTYTTNSLFWGRVSAGPRAAARRSNPTKTDLVPLKITRPEGAAAERQ